MTSKEAIVLLKKATLFKPTLENRDYPEAFDRAIKALEFVEENFPKTFEDYLRGEDNE